MLFLNISYIAIPFGVSHTALGIFVLLFPPPLKRHHYRELGSFPLFLFKSQLQKIGFTFSDFLIVLHL